MVLFAIRPGGFDGSGGRGQPLSEVLKWTLPQLAFFCFGDKSMMGSACGSPRSGEEVKREVDMRYMEDAEYRERYRKKISDAIRKAKESLQ